MSRLVNWKHAFIYRMEQARTRITSSGKFTEIPVPRMKELPCNTDFWEEHLYFSLGRNIFRVSPEGKMEEVREGDPSLLRLNREKIIKSCSRLYLKLQSSLCDGNYYVTKDGSILNDSTWKEVGKVVPGGYEIYGEKTFSGQYFPSRINLFFYRNKPQLYLSTFYNIVGNHIFFERYEIVFYRNLFWEDESFFVLLNIPRVKLLGAVYSKGATTLFVKDAETKRLRIFRYP